MNNSIINIAEIAPVSEVNGPGKRAVIWVQGCSKRCSGCWNAAYLDFSTKLQLTPQQIFDFVRQKTLDFSLVEGITFSGGEPFEQAAALSEAASLFKSRGMTIMSYSGDTLEEIKIKGKPQTDFLGNLDILVDGEYVKEESCDRLWRSSLNQKVYFLTERYRSFEPEINKESREFEVVLSENELRVTGFPRLDLLKKFK